MLVYTDEGLYVSAPHRGNLLVGSYIERLRVNGQVVRVFDATIDQITKTYAAFRQTAAGQPTVSVDSRSEEQKRIIQLLTEAVSEDTSDIHFMVKSDHCDVRFRVLGRLETKHGYTREEGMALVSTLYGSMCDIASTFFNSNASQRARVSRQYTEALGLYGARVQTRPTHDGLLMVIRLLKSDDRIMTHAELGFLPQQVELMEEIAAMPYGVALISGPTGSGKSRTMQATMAMILKNEEDGIHLLTIEDPPEYPIPGANVTPLVVKDRNDPNEVSETWQKSVSEAMRLDPDVIMVGEISDLGSATTTFSAAKTGHLVWSTLHSNEATTIPTRLMDMKVAMADVLDPSQMVGLTAQRLLPVLCVHCKIPFSQGHQRLRPQLLARLKAVTPPAMLSNVFVLGEGCTKCRKRGIQGRTPVIEVVKTTVGFMEACKSDDPLFSRRYWVQQMGGITMLRHALHLVWNGLVDPKAAERVQPLDHDLHLLGMDYATQSQLA